MDKFKKKEYDCKICKKKFYLRKYALHMSIHRNTNNMYYPCPLPICNRTFTKFTTLKSHISRDHNKTITTTNSTDLSNLMCNVEMCSQKLSNESEMISHLQTHIRNGIKVHCP